MAYFADLTTERERQLTAARANQTTGLTNGRVAIGHRKSSLVLSACFPVVKWRSRYVATSAFNFKSALILVIKPPGQRLWYDVRCV